MKADFCMFTFLFCMPWLHSPTPNSVGMHALRAGEVSGVISDASVGCHNPALLLCCDTAEK